MRSFLNVNFLELEFMAILRKPFCVNVITRSIKLIVLEKILSIKHEPSIGSGIIKHFGEET